MSKAAVKLRSRHNHRALSNSHNHLAQRDVYHRRLQIEPLEQRQLLAVVYPVANTSGDATVENSLPWAVAQASAAGGGAIEFNIPADQSNLPGNVFEIQPTETLALDNITIDGSSEVAYLGYNPNSSGGPAIVINGSSADAGSDGLSLHSNATVLNLCIQDFPGNGIQIFGSNNVVAGCFIGTDATGTEPSGNGGDAVYVGSGASSNTIGGTDIGARNVISGNADCGVEIVGPGTAQNIVEGNYIGTDAHGTASLGNATDGVYIGSGASGNTVGGIDPAARNIISGNVDSGVGISGSGTSHNLVEGNYIGTDASGTVALGNGRNGVLINSGASGNTVGGTQAGARNVISGNDQAGVAIVGSGSAQNFVEGNYIGANASGTASLGNVADGIVVLDSASGNTIGGTEAGAGNVISGNGADGVAINDSGTTQNVVEGNYIGTDATATAVLSNQYDGVGVGTGASGNIVGGLTATARNVISGNSGNGVGIYGPATTENIVQGNYIGTSASGNASLGNKYQGICIYSDASRNTIGGTEAGARNVISGNGGNGVEIWGSGAAQNVIEGNYIGTDAAGSASLGNRCYGVTVNLGASANTVGETDAGAGNLIAYNAWGGVCVIDNSAGNTIRGNSIHDNGGLGIDLGGDGVTPNQSTNPATGPNNGQNYPVLFAASTGSSTTVAGTLASEPNATFTLDFYADSSPDPSGYGQGQRYLGSATVTTGPSGDAPFTVTLPGTTAPGDYITATATDAQGDTSEFSQDITQTAPIVAGLSPQLGPASGKTTVTIIGTHLAGVTAVRFGTHEARNFVVNSDSQITATSPAESPGTVDVTVVTVAGTSATSPADHYTFTVAPIVSAVVPNTGPAAGGARVVITGANLARATAVMFGNVKVTAFKSDTATQIVLLSPPGKAGMVDVTVVTAGGRSAKSSADRYTYVAAPTVTKVIPTAGPTSGGTNVTITGKNLTNVTVVDFGTTLAAAIISNSATQIVVTSPARKAGTVDIRVVTAGGTSAVTSHDAFSFVAAPTVAKIKPASGTASGGTKVTITGKNLANATAVNFDATAVTKFVSDSATQIVVTSPAGAVGIVDVTVTTRGGTSATSSADNFTYLSPYAVQKITDSEGNIEYQMWKDGFHFGTVLQTPQGAIGFRGHPDQHDANGWGTTVQENVYIAGAGVDATGGQVISAVAGSSGIQVTAGGDVPSVLGSAGTWSWASTITYDATQQKAVLAGSTTVTLAAALSGDMNIGREDSNYLYDYRLNGGGVGPTGDMKSVTVVYGPDSSVHEFQWTPLPGREGTSPQDASDDLTTIIWGQINKSDPLKAAIAKPTVEREIVSVDPATKLIVACNWDSSKVGYQFDNVGVEQIVRPQNTNAQSFVFKNTENWTIPDKSNPTVRVNSLVTSNRQPVLTGTVSRSSPSKGIANVMVVVKGGVTPLTLSAQITGSRWSAAVPTTLASGKYQIQATATDNAGNTAFATVSLTIQSSLTIARVAVAEAGDDAEYGELLGPQTLAAQQDSAADDHVDLLTAVMHEMGHVLGYQHVADGLMSATLPLGIRRA